MLLLTENFLSKYPDFPESMNSLGKFVYLRTYSRYLSSEKRRETFKETIARSVEYNMELHIKHCEKIGIPYSIKSLRKEAETLFNSEFNLKQSLSGRTKWVGGADTKVAEKYPLSNFNCSFLNITKWDDLGDLFYLLLVGTGVGFKCTKKMAYGLPKIRTNFEIEHIPYAYAGKINHLEHTKLVKRDTTVTIYVGDSKEGWVESLRKFFKIVTTEEYEQYTKIIFSYNHVRPSGEKLKTFGGTASGHLPLKEMFEGFYNVLHNKLDPTLDPINVDEKGYGHVRPIHILDMGNMVGNNVVVGGVRRTAEIFLFDPDDFESLWAKYGVNGFWNEKSFKDHEYLKKYLNDNNIPYPKWFDKIGERYYDEHINIDFVTKKPRREKDGSLSPYNFGTGFYHRAMSNNSIGFIDKPSHKFMDFVFKMMQSEGEPGFINLYEASRRRLSHMGINDPKFIKEYAEKVGLNPCAEILLQSYGVCNLTTLNVRSFVKKVNGGYVLDRSGLIEAQRLSAREGVRMSLVTLELPHWSEVQSTDRLIGTSLTGWQDAMSLVSLTKEDKIALLKELRSVSREEADLYATHLRIPSPLLTTTVKPEGTLSQTMGGVSNGLHWAHSRYFIRRVRINAEDPLAKTILELKGWVVNPENGTPGSNYEEKMKNARTYVIDFPVFSGTRVTEDDVAVREQLDNYFMFQENYVEHNASNTIKVGESEWEEAKHIVLDHWNNFVGVSFLAKDGGTYQLAPYESIDEEQYQTLKSKMQDFDFDLLQEYETEGDDDSSLEGMEGCEAGICPIR